jgi:hypothetical protein
MACCSGPQKLQPLVVSVATATNADNHFMHREYRQMYALSPCARALLGQAPFYWQTVPGAHRALKEPFTVTELVPPRSVAGKLKVPSTSDCDDPVITSCPEVELKSCEVPLAPPVMYESVAVGLVELPESGRRLYVPAASRPE